MRAIVIDAETHARKKLHALLAPYRHVAVVGEAASVASGRTLLARHDYDLVFADIQLPGGSGFDLVPAVRADAHLVFVTASERHAARAFNVNASDYLLKPVHPARLAESLRRLDLLAHPPAARQQARKPLTPRPAPLGPRDFVHVKVGALKTRNVPLAHIAVVRSFQNYSELQLADGTRHFVRRTMKEWCDQLPPTHFVRVHRQIIVGLAHYRGLDYSPGGKSQVYVAGFSAPVAASYRYVPELRVRLVALGQQMLVRRSR